MENKRPIGVFIIALLLLIHGIASLVGAIAISSIVGALAGGNIGPVVAVFAILSLIIGGVLIVAAIGLLKMKRWALVVFTIAAILSLIKSFTQLSSELGIGIYLVIYQIIAIIYLLIIRKKFS